MMRVGGWVDGWSLDHSVKKGSWGGGRPHGLVQGGSHAIRDLHPVWRLLLSAAFWNPGNKLDPMANKPTEHAERHGPFGNGAWGLLVLRFQILFSLL